MEHQCWSTNASISIIKKIYGAPMPIHPGTLIPSWTVHQSPHCRAIASATFGNVLDLYFPLLAWTNCLISTACASAINGGRFFVQYSVFFEYGSPNQNGWMKHDGWGRLARAIGIGFSTATKGAFAFKHLKKNSRACIIFSSRSGSITPPLTSCTLDTLHR